MEDYFQAPLSERHKRFVTLLDFAEIERFVRNWSGLPGRPTADRQALARAFAAKPVFKIDQTKLLIERLQSDKQSRVLCGWNSIGQLPSEATFSRAFKEFALSKLPSRVHEALIKSTHKDRLVGHISRDSTEITAREKPLQKQSVVKPKYKRGRPKKGEVRETKDKRLDKQSEMSLAEMLADLPVACDVGNKLNTKGYKQSWIGYKLHLDLADGCIPISCLITSASVHDSQVAIPLATMTNERCTNCYDLMDSAYDAPQIKAYSRQLGHVPIIDTNARANRHRVGRSLTAPPSHTTGRTDLRTTAVIRRYTFCHIYRQMV